ncbi:MAG: hypothetical protein LBS31_06745 [Candidatus Adiutrix sp.]|jgi:hypothetical protein|nr:hypothetical protein [Candidatus Adiutrix sp.]
MLKFKPAPGAACRFQVRAAVSLWLAVVFMAAPAAAQPAATVRNAYTPMGQVLTTAAVRDELERRMTLSPQNEAALWNTGYDFFRNYPKNQDTARAIKDGFLRARPGTPQQRAVLMKAAIYWEKIHDYGLANVPVGLDDSTRDKIYFGETGKAGDLAMRRPGSKHKGYGRYNRPGRHINKRPPYQGRPDNPYPGKYYPGLYPP